MESSKRKIPSVVRAKAGSRRIRMSGRGFALLAGGRRERRRRLEKPQRTRHIMAMTEMVRLQPTRSKSEFIRSGKAMPPMEPPVVAMPVASPRRSENQWPTTAMDGVKSREVPKPPRMPKVRRNCGYSDKVVSQPKESHMETGDGP